MNMKKEEKDKLIDSLINEVETSFGCVEHAQTYINEETGDYVEIEFDVREYLQIAEFFKSDWAFLIAKDCDEYFKEKYNTQAIHAETDFDGESKFCICVDFAQM